MSHCCPGSGKPAVVGGDGEAECDCPHPRMLNMWDLIAAACAGD